MKRESRKKYKGRRKEENRNRAGAFLNPFFTKNG